MKKAVATSSIECNQGNVEPSSRDVKITNQNDVHPTRDFAVNQSRRGSQKRRYRSNERIYDEITEDLKRELNVRQTGRRDSQWIFENGCTPAKSSENGGIDQKDMKIVDAEQNLLQESIAEDTVEVPSFSGTKLGPALPERTHKEMKSSKFQRISTMLLGTRPGSQETTVAMANTHSSPLKSLKQRGRRQFVKIQKRQWLEDAGVWTNIWWSWFPSRPFSLKKFAVP